jgi:DNA-binding GntR family transcriptional regulator
MILSFELYPGTRVTESELAKQFGVSRTPIRAALQRLEAEGALVIRPKQGCFIRALDIAELTGQYRVRVALEVLAIETAVTCMSDRDLERLAEAWNPKVQPGRSEDPEEMERRDEGFHLALAEGSGNRALVPYLRAVNDQIRIVRRLDFTHPERIDQTYQEHFAICRRLIEREPDAAKREMASHIERSEEFAKNLTLIQLARHQPQWPRGGPP